MARNSIQAYDPASDKSYYMPVETAKHLTKSAQAAWQGPKRIILGADQRIKVTWAVRQSGYAGPQVMQVIT